MRIKAYFSSLRFKVTFAVSLALLLVLGVYSALRYERQREQEIGNAQEQAALASRVISAALQHEMQTQDISDLGSILSQVGQQPGVRSVLLLDQTSQVRFSSSPSDANSRLSTGDPGCRECHASQSPPTQNSIILTSTSGESVLRYYNPILNQPACYACHDPQQRVLGALVSDLSLAGMNQNLSADLRDGVVAGAGTLVVVVLAVNWLLGRLTLDRLDRFRPVLRRLGQSDLSPRLAQDGDDEIGQLAATFNQMADRMETRDRENARLYRELQEKEAGRTQLLQKIIGAQEEERKRLSRELHDDLSQSLTALSAAVQSLLQTSPPELATLHAPLEQLHSLTVSTLAEASRWIQDLRPRSLDDLGLAPAIRLYAESRLEASHTTVQVEPNLSERLPPEIEITLFRVVQEAIANVARHAHARRVVIQIALYDTGTVVARVEDDGVGFIPGKYLHSTDGLRGMGLLGMRERVALVGGTLMIDSTPGRGTVVRAEIPWKQTVP
ncbi:MAG: HAMP domain-containing sensor histidine kinase [Chloroflexi bacterium]|nr:HAMP domain-containing sensor histidine kinase [Chloroflexota bacterium]